MEVDDQSESRRGSTDDDAFDVPPPPPPANETPVQRAINGIFRFPKDPPFVFIQPLFYR